MVRQKVFHSLLVAFRANFAGILKWPRSSGLIGGKVVPFSAKWWRDSNRGRRNEGAAAILSAVFHATPPSDAFSSWQRGPLGLIGEPAFNQVFLLISRILQTIPDFVFSAKSTKP